MSLREETLAKTEQVIDTLRCLPPGEVAVGWDEARVKKWLPIFERVRDALVAPVPLPKEYESFIIVRGLDFAGITAGRICDLSVEITEGLSKLVTSGE